MLIFNLLIPYPDSDDSYDFRISRAGDKSPNTNYSDWIIHLAGKTWASMSMLRELSEILKKKAPEIDWGGSFDYLKERYIKYR